MHTPLLHAGILSLIVYRCAHPCGHSQATLLSHFLQVEGPLVEVSASPSLSFAVSIYCRVRVYEVGGQGILMRGVEHWDHLVLYVQRPKLR